MDFADVRANDWFVVNQFTVIEGAGSSPAGRGGGEGVGAHRRPDIVVFVNGLPLALIELKNAADEDAAIWSAYAQFQRCHDILSGSICGHTPKKPALSMPGFSGQHHRMPFNANNPACGSGGMFVQSEKFVESYGGPVKCEIRSASVEGQPVRKSQFAVRHTTSFAIRNSSFEILAGPENADTFRRDLHPDLRADRQIANAEVRMWN